MPEDLPAILPVPDLKPHELAALAREVVMARLDLDATLKIFNLTPEQYAKIEDIPFFKHALEQTSIEWNSAKTTPERVKLQSAAYLEAGLPTLSARMVQNNDNSSVEIAKLLAKMSGVDQTDKNVGMGSTEKFTINISMGADAKLQVVKDVTPAAIPDSSTP